nr:glycosyltransferase [Rhodococcus sp. 15-1154-1]
MPILRSETFDFCVSTGAALATFILPLSRIFGARAIYIESVSRTDGPSLTGRLMAVTPGVETYTQHVNWGLRKWKYAGSLLDNWVVRKNEVIDRPLTIFVTLGTIKPYKFDRAVSAILKTISSRDIVVWQLGTSYREGLPGQSYREMTAAEVRHNIENSDVVVTHAGVGSIINILDAGSLPVVAVRRKDRREHIDNHQQQIAKMMVDRGLAEMLDLENPTRTTLLTAASKIVEKRYEDG